MKVNSIQSTNFYTNKMSMKKKNRVLSPNFQGNNTYAKAGAGIMGTLGTLGAIGGTIIMTGGVALPWVIGYGAACATTGAILGHQIDKDDNEKNDKEN